MPTLPDTTPNDLQPAAPRPPPRAWDIVGVGASAGGLAAVEALLGAVVQEGLPAVAIVLVQHRAPDPGSMLIQLLGRSTPLKVVEARDGMRVRPGCVYVIAPGCDLALRQGVLHVTPPALMRGMHLPIDFFFRSLAEDRGTRAGGVVLSGTGSDGTEGLRAILDQGGVAVAQMPETAQFDAMPLSAAALGAGVLQVAPAQIMARVLQALQQRQAPDAPGPPASPATQDAPDAGDMPAEPGPLPEDTAGLAAVLQRVTLTTRHDFSQYKPSTLLRRIERRMAIHGSVSMAEYAQRVAQDAQETELLFKELLIGVTSFFRDPPLWQTVADTVLPGLLARAAARPVPQLRAWVAGCSTGEEAYTLAMLLCEALDGAALSQPLKLQIFATDLSADAVQTARRGIYAGNVAQTLSPQRLARFFVPEGHGYRVANTLRELVIFARHDLISDPPFMRLDIVSCRNLLIYFKPVLQNKVLPLFHHVLQPGGALLLGSSETIGRFDTLFVPLDARSRVFMRGAGVLPRGAAVFPLKPSAPTLSTTKDLPMAATPTGDDPSLQSLADRLMLDEFVPAAVLVSPQGDILYVSGRTGRFLEPAAGKANWNVHVMAREGIRAALGAALAQAQREQRSVDVHGLAVDTGSVGPVVDLTVRPLSWPGHSGLSLVVFHERTAEVPVVRNSRARGGADKAQLQRALDELQLLREQMTSSQEELQSANEELQSTNEELQSANEELTTSKEEMQAMNEELLTVNAELTSKLDDLSLAQSDLLNLLNSTQIATVFLDGALNVRRFTERAKRVINLRDSDIGRPLSDLTNSLEYPTLAEDIATVLHTLEFRETAIKATDGRWFSVRIMPYRTQDNVIDGSVITFVDITEAKALEARLREATGGT